ncbi:MAG: hypothetical protein ACI4S2_12465 [Lachnospiraceae bacterium]
MMKPSEVIIIRNGKPTFAVKLKISNKKNDRDTYVYMDNDEIKFNNDSWFRDMDDFNAGEESHAIAKEIFVSQLQTTIRNKILELKQLESLFRELNMENYLGTTLSDNQIFLTDVRELLEEKTKEIDAVKKQISSVEEQIVDVEEIKEISAKTVKENVRPIARKNSKEGGAE